MREPIENGGAKKQPFFELKFVIIRSTLSDKIDANRL